VYSSVHVPLTNDHFWSPATAFSSGLPLLALVGDVDHRGTSEEESEQGKRRGGDAIR
jgi:hypothetical protein